MNLEPLEDTADDVLRKALLNEGLSLHDLPNREPARSNFIRNKLSLDPRKLYSMPNTLPVHPLPEGLERHQMPFNSWTLNIWTLQTESGLFVIDTGLDRSQLPQILAGREPSAILITHRHRDHVGGLIAYPKIPVWDASVFHTLPCQLTISGHNWMAYNLNGHTDDCIGWVTQWRDKTILFSGDALFARSIGKCPNKTQLAISNLVLALQDLPDDTIVCPGHGPVTTIGDEWEHNPFLPNIFQEHRN